jgi:PEP-CTERM motif-containing protein
MPGLPAQPLVTNNVFLDSFFGNVNTTVPNDFYIPTGTGITVVVPAGVSFLAVGILDSYYADDSGNPTVTINETAPPDPPDPPGVPEPATLGLFGIGAGALLALRRYRSR